MKRAVLALTALGLALGLVSCSGMTILSNYRRLENIELVRTITADAAPEGVTVSICGAAGKESGPRQYECSGPSMGVALGELMLMPLGRDAILSHAESLLVGEELAKTGMDQCLDYMERFSETRLDTGVLIVRGGRALDLAAGLTGKETPAPDVIAGLGKNISRMGEGYFFTCREIASSLAQNGCALVQCVKGEEGEKLFEERGELDIRPAGFAVLGTEGGPAYLTEEETLGTLVLLNKFRSKNMDLEVEGTVLTVSVDRAEAGFEPVFEDGALAGIDIALKLEANVICLTGDGALTDALYRKSAEEALSRRILAAVNAALRRSRQLGADFLDLEGVVRRRAPLKMERSGESWAEVFPRLALNVRAESTLLRTFDIVDPPDVAGEEENRSPWEKLIESLNGS